MPRDRVRHVAEASNDGSQRLFSVAFDPSADTCIASGGEAAALADAALDRGALAAAAQALGVADRLVALAVDYASQREQFGVPIGTFQAVQHRCADAFIDLDDAPFDLI